MLADEEPFDNELMALASDNANERYQAPATKKARVSELPQSLMKPVQPKKSTRQPRKNLSLLPTMPLDIIFEILGFIAPRDLLSLAKTNKLFRRTLLSPQATSVWKASRKRVGGPDCPSDHNEVEWALLLFGSGCQNCGTPHIRKIDFAIRRRVCSSCKKNNVIAKTRFKNRFANEADYVLELLPSTSDNGDSMHSFHSKRGCTYYWIPDIYAMLRRLDALEADIIKGLPNARQNLEDFKARQIQRVQNVKNDVPRLNAWKMVLAQEKMQESHDNKERRKRAIFDRMLQLGYTIQDLGRLEFDAACRKTTELTERIWQRIRPGLEAKATADRNARLERDREAILMKRRRIVRTCYNDYKATLVPSQWRYLPRVLEICNFDCFKTLIEADPNVELGPEDFAGCMEMLPELLATRMEELKMSARESMADAIDSYAMEGQVPPFNEVSPTVDILDLATATFQCQRQCRRSGTTMSARLVIGWDTIAMHHCEDENEGVEKIVTNFYYGLYTNSVEDQPRFAFDRKASVVADVLVRCAGLGENALASDMDAKNLRFSCAVCEIKKGKNGFYKVGYGWREAVYHSISAHPNITFGPLNIWQKISAENMAKVMEKERSNPKWPCPKYTCNHCPELVDQIVVEGIITHVQTMHGIENPQNPDDYFNFERYRLLDWPIWDDENRSYDVPGPYQ